MTETQRSKLNCIVATSDTATLAEFRLAVGESIELESIPDAMLLIRALRICEKNSPGSQYEGATLILSQALRDDLQLLSRGADTINSFFAWLEKSSVLN